MGADLYCHGLIWFCLPIAIVRFDIAVSLMFTHIGDSLLLVCETSSHCTIEIQEIDVKVVVQAFDKVDEPFYEGIGASEMSCVSSRLMSCRSRAL